MIFGMNLNHLAVEKKMLRPLELGPSQSPLANYG